MSNVIRPAFGAKAKPTAPNSPKRIERFTVLRGYGSAGSQVVGLVRIDEGAGAASLRVVVGPDGGDAAMTVVTLPDTAEGEATAEMVATAVLRALRIASGTLPNERDGCDQGNGL